MWACDTATPSTATPKRRLRYPTGGPAESWIPGATTFSPVWLAKEGPDPASVGATLECDPGTSVALVSLYGGAPLTGMARVTAGEASAVAEAETARAGASKLALRTDHPVFAAFTVDGRLAIAVGDARRPVEVPAAHLAKRRRFAELCSG